jgi:hypothetical protein
MIRVFSLCGMGGAFLMISPNLRSVVQNGLAAGLGSLDTYSPWSYIACAVAGLIFVALYISRGSRPM